MNTDEHSQKNDSRNKNAIPTKDMKDALPSNIRIAFLAALKAARQGKTPPDFPWDLKDKSGRTVAHETLKNKSPLPPDFNQWSLLDGEGQTVAHVAAKYNVLPNGFDRWDLADEDGWTVAHVAAKYNVLPNGFDRWELADENGFTVAHVEANYNVFAEERLGWYDW
jgi:hypothetical protein